MRVLRRCLWLLIVATVFNAIAPAATAQDVDAAPETDCAAVTAQFRAAVDTFIEAHRDRSPTSYDALERYAATVIPKRVDPHCVPDIVSSYEAKDHWPVYRGFGFAFPVEDYYNIFGFETNIVSRDVVLRFILMKNGMLEEVVVTPKWDTMWVP